MVLREMKVHRLEQPAADVEPDTVRFRREGRQLPHCGHRTGRDIGHRRRQLRSQPAIVRQLARQHLVLLRQFDGRRVQVRKPRRAREAGAHFRRRHPVGLRQRPCHDDYPGCR